MRLNNWYQDHISPNRESAAKHRETIAAFRDAHGKSAQDVPAPVATAIGAQPAGVSAAIEVRQYKSRRAYERDAKRRATDGWFVQSVTTTTSRRMMGCLVGIVGYWLVPNRTVYHVTYAKSTAA